MSVKNAYRLLPSAHDRRHGCHRVSCSSTEAPSSTQLFHGSEGRGQHRHLFAGWRIKVLKNRPHHFERVGGGGFGVGGWGGWAKGWSQNASQRGAGGGGGVVGVVN